MISNVKRKKFKASTMDSSGSCYLDTLMYKFHYLVRSGLGPEVLINLTFSISLQVDSLTTHLEPMMNTNSLEEVRTKLQVHTMKLGLRNNVTNC